CVSLWTWPWLLSLTVAHLRLESRLSAGSPFSWYAWHPSGGSPTNVSRTRRQTWAYLPDPSRRRQTCGYPFWTCPGFKVTPLRCRPRLSRRSTELTFPSLLTSYAPS